MTTNKTVAKKVTKKVAPKKATKEKNINRNIDEVTLENYSMKMVIPTGEYANIQPEITVKAYSMDKAHDFMAPHMNKLWKEYYLINNRRPEPVVKTPATTPVSDFGSTAKSFVPTNNPVSTEKPANFKYLPDKVAKETGGKVVGKLDQDKVADTAQPPASGVAITKATQAIESCLSLDALNIITAQVEKSVKLTHEDKEALQPLLLAKSEQLFDGI